MCRMSTRFPPYMVSSLMVGVGACPHRKRLQLCDLPGRPPARHGIDMEDGIGMEKQREKAEADAMSASTRLTGASYFTNSISR